MSDANKIFELYAEALERSKMHVKSDAKKHLELYAEALERSKMHVMSDGRKEWRMRGILYREDGPAIEYRDGTKAWMFLGMIHRLNGAAIEYPDGKKELWVGSRLYDDVEDWARAALKYERRKHDEDPTQDDVDEKVAQVMQQDLFS